MNHSIDAIITRWREELDKLRKEKVEYDDRVEVIDPRILEARDMLKKMDNIVYYHDTEAKVQALMGAMYKVLDVLEERL